VKIKIRPAKISEVSIIDSFQHGIGVHERSLDSNIKRRGRIRYFTQADIKKLILSKKSVILIAESDEPLGCGSAKIRKNRASWSRYKYQGSIEMMFVKKEYRKKGVGRKIIKELLNWFKKQKVKDIRLQVYYNNVSAVRFYRKSGFKDYIFEMIYMPK